MSTTNPSQPNQFISKHVLEWHERRNAEDQRHADAIKRLDDELRRIFDQQPSSGEGLNLEFSNNDPQLLHTPLDRVSVHGPDTPLTNPDIPTSVLPFAKYFQDLNSVNFTQEVHTLRGSVTYRGDIISPIDEKWDAES